MMPSVKNSVVRSLVAVGRNIEMGKKGFDAVPFVLAVSAIITVIIIVSTYYSRVESAAPPSELPSFNHSQVKHGKAKEY